MKVNIHWLLMMLFSSDNFLSMKHENYDCILDSFTEFPLT